MDIYSRKFAIMVIIALVSILTLQVMTKHKEIVHGDFTYQLIGVDVATHVHVNNHKTNNSSVVVPIKVLKELLEGE